jgi:transposase
LARLLWAGQLAGVWTPDERIRAMRRRLARRAQLVRARSRAKNEIHAVLMRCLKDRPPASDLFGVKGRRWLAEQQLPVVERETVDSAMRQVEFLDTEIAAVEQLIAADALSWPEVKRLMTVPGVNVIVAATFMAAVGDIRRFPDRRRLTAYLGLDPRVRQSGAGPAAHGHISKQGSGSARHALAEACWPARPDRRLLSTRQSQARSLDRDRRLGAQARVSVLVPAHPRRGLRLRAAVADQQEDAPPRTAGRRAALARRPPRLVDQRRDAPSRTRARAAGPARLRTHRHRPPAREGRERNTGPRI